VLKPNTTAPRLPMAEASSTRVHEKPPLSRGGPPVAGGRRGSTGVVVGGTGVAVGAVGDEVGAGGAPGQPRIVTLLVSIVTSPFRARALPGTIVAPVCRAMLVSARMFPTN
jgi:hypothetical protein